MDIDILLGITLQNRKAVKKIMDSLTTSKMNVIPSGFNNNIIWNCAHILSIQQTLIYGLCGQPFHIPKEQVNNFTIGTRPERDYEDDFIDVVKTQLADTFAQMEQDIHSGHLEVIYPFMTALRYEIKDVPAALAFNMYHEALHMGYILNLRRFL